MRLPAGLQGGRLLAEVIVPARGAPGRARQEWVIKEAGAVGEASGRRSPRRSSRNLAGWRRAPAARVQKAFALESPTPRRTSVPSRAPRVEKAQTDLPDYTTEMSVIKDHGGRQRRILDNLLTSGVAGVSISAIDPA